MIELYDLYSLLIDMLDPFLSYCQQGALFHFASIGKVASLIKLFWLTEKEWRDRNHRSARFEEAVFDDIFEERFYGKRLVLRASRLSLRRHINDLQLR